AALGRRGPGASEARSPRSGRALDGPRVSTLVADEALAERWRRENPGALVVRLRVRDADRERGRGALCAAGDAGRLLEPGEVRARSGQIRSVCAEVRLLGVGSVQDVADHEVVRLPQVTRTHGRRAMAQGRVSARVEVAHVGKIDERRVDLDPALPRDGAGARGER